VGPGDALVRGRADDEGALRPRDLAQGYAGRTSLLIPTMYSPGAAGASSLLSARRPATSRHVPLGSFDAPEAKGITPTPSLGGAITTAGNLIFIGATVDSRFRSFDARTGKELWSEKLDAPAHAIPSTYMGRDGKQYVAIAAGGGGFLQSPTSDTVIAFSLQ
jgi:hypothetical protein